MQSLCVFSYSSAWVWTLNCQILFDSPPPILCSDNNCGEEITQAMWMPEPPIWEHAPMPINGTAAGSRIY